METSLDLTAFTRTGQRAARVSTFLLETWSRLAAKQGSSARDRATELSWVAENACALHGLRPQVVGTPPSGPCVLVANHITYFDPVVIASLLPLTAVAKREVLHWPVVGELARKLGTLAVTREDTHSGARCLREVLRSLEQGVSVLVFPEGTTTQGGRVLPFKRGAFGAAAVAGVPVVPVSIQYDRPNVAWVGEDSFLPHYVKSMTHACTRVKVRFFDPMEVASTAEASEVADRARRLIASAIWRDAFASRVAPVQDAWQLVSA
jgi:1-acyl-sn-glycerol-3-phosphate acyltransferase